MAASKTSSQTKPSQSERTFQMLIHFLKLREQGLSIKQIAYKYDLSTSTVYKYLDHVVEQHNAIHPDAPITREMLLDQPHTQYNRADYSYALLAPIDISQFRTDFNSMLQGVDALLSAVAGTILEQEMLELLHI